MYYKIGINALQIAVRTGIRPHEYHTPQPVVVDAELWVVWQGDLQLDVNIPNYSSIRTTLINVAQSRHVPLLEQLARDLGDACLAYQGVKFITIRLTKLKGLPDARVYVDMSFGEKPVL